MDLETTTVKRSILAAVAALSLGTSLGMSLGAFEAQAQYYRDDDDRPRRMERRYEERRYDEDRFERRRSRYDDDRGSRGSRGGGICVTARGNCMTRPAPLNAPCGCEVPGFGFKRGAIGG